MNFRDYAHLPGARTSFRRLGVPLLFTGVVLLYPPLTAQELDVNRDGVVDFAVERGGEYWDYANFVNWWDLVPRGTNAIHTNTTFTVTDVVGPEPAAAWLGTVPPRLYSQGNQKIGPGMSWPTFGGLLWDHPDRWLGLRFATADGVHFGWAEFNLVQTGPFDYTARLVDSGFQPQPGGTIQVGQKLPPLPPEEPGVTLKPLIVISSIDFVLERRVQTNTTAGVVSRAVTLLPKNGFELLAQPGRVVGRSVSVPVEFPLYALIPADPLWPGVWSGDARGVTLQIEETALATQQQRSEGPLTTSETVTVLFRQAPGGTAPVGWLTLNRALAMTAKGHLPSGYPLVGEPTPSAEDGTASVRRRLDLDGDGVADGVLISAQATLPMPMPEGGVNFLWELLSPLGATELLHQETEGLEVLEDGAVVPVSPVASSRWRPNPGPMDYVIQCMPSPGCGMQGWLGRAAELLSCCCLPPDCSGPLLGRTEGYAALRVPKPDGFHYAWVHLRRPADWAEETEIVGWSYEVRPDTAVIAGEPAPVVLEGKGNGPQLVLSWNLSLPGWRLESSPSLAPAAWQVVPVVENNRCVLPVTEAAGFYRLQFKP